MRYYIALDGTIVEAGMPEEVQLYNAEWLR